mgnify:CR=1 FL=1
MSGKVKDDKPLKPTTRPYVGNEAKTPHEESRMEETYEARWHNLSLTHSYLLLQPQQKRVMKILPATEKCVDDNCVIE